MANIRSGRFIPVLDLALATGRRGLQDLTNSFAIITEYNTKVQELPGALGGAHRQHDQQQEDPSSSATAAPAASITAAVTGEQATGWWKSSTWKSARGGRTDVRGSGGVTGGRTSGAPGQLLQSRAVTKRVLVIAAAVVVEQQAVTRCLEAVA